MPCRTVTFSSIFIGTAIPSYSANNNAAVIHPTGLIWLPDMPCWTVTSYFGERVRGGQFDRRVVGLFHIGQSLSLAFSLVPCWIPCRTVTSYFGARVCGGQFDYFVLDSHFIWLRKRKRGCDSPYRVYIDSERAYTKSG